MNEILLHRTCQIIERNFGNDRSNLLRVFFLQEMTAVCFYDSHGVREQFFHALECTAQNRIFFAPNDSNL